MPVTTEADVSQMFDTAMNAFNDTMKVGFKAQEEIIKFWSGNLAGSTNGGNPVAEWQKRTRALLDQATPAVQKNAEEFVKLVEQNYKKSMELMKKAVEADQTVAVSNMAERTQKLWQGLLDMVRDNAQAMAQANVRLVELWAELVRSGIEKGSAGGVPPMGPAPVIKTK